MKVSYRMSTNPHMYKLQTQDQRSSNKLTMCSVLRCDTLKNKPEWVSNCDNVCLFVCLQFFSSGFVLRKDKLHKENTKDDGGS